MHAETLTNLAKWGRVDKGDLSRAMSEAGVEPEVKGKAHLYPIDSAIAVIVSMKTNSLRGQNSSDVRNLAQAEKLTLETEILRKRHVPVDDAAEIIAREFRAVAEVIAASDLGNEARELLVDKLHRAIDSVGADLRREYSESE